MSEQSRKEVVQGFIESRRKQLEEGVSLEAREKIENEIAAFNLELEQIEKAEQEAAEQEAAEQEAAEQEAAHKVVIQEATEKAAYIMDNLIIEGFTVRQLAAGEEEYQLLKIGVQGEFISQAESSNRAKQLSDLVHKEELQAVKDVLIAATYREVQLERQIEELQQRIVIIISERDHANDILQKLSLEVSDANSKRDAAVREKEGIELLLQTKQEEIELLRTEKAVGAKGAPHVIDIESQRNQMKALAEQIKNSRIHVYDVVPDSDINPKNFTAKRADTGEIVTYNWTQTNKYIELKDEAEVSQFRQQHAEQNTLPDITLANTPDLLKVEPPAEEPFRQEVSMANGSLSEDGQSKGTLEERVAALEAHVFGFVKGQEVA